MLLSDVAFGDRGTCFSFNVHYDCTKENMICFLREWFECSLSLYRYVWPFDCRLLPFTFHLVLTQAVVLTHEASGRIQPCQRSNCN